MLFNSYTFLLVFLPAVLAGAFILGRVRTSMAVAWLVFARCSSMVVEPAPRCAAVARSPATISRAMPSPGAAAKWRPRVRILCGAIAPTCG